MMNKQLPPDDMMIYEMNIDIKHYVRITHRVLTELDSQTKKQES